MKLIVLMLIGAVIGAGCRPNVGSHKRTPESELTEIERDAVFGELRKVDLPFDASFAVKAEGGLMVFGDDQMASLGQDGSLGRPMKYNVVKQLTVGGKARIVPIRDPVPNPQLCSPKAGVSVGASFNIYAECDHSDQFWRVTPSGDTASIELIVFPYGEENMSKALLTGVGGNEDRSFLSIEEDGTPLLAELDVASWTTRIVWKGPTHFGPIAKVIFVKRKGTMLLTTGTLLRSLDGGRTWGTLSQIPLDELDFEIEMEFSDEYDGAILSRGKVYRTADGGKTWKPDESITGDLYVHLCFDGEVAIVTTENGGIAFKTKEMTSWKLETVLQSRSIASVALQNRLFALFSEGNLYLGRIIER